MADLISREAAIKLLRGECVAKYPSSFYFGLFAAADEIDKLPAADAVEVVRCKDCKYSMLWRKPTDKVIGDCWIRKMNSDDEQFPMVGADDFCSYGERREENAAD